MTPSLSAFAQIPLNKSRLTDNYEASFEFLQKDRGIFTDGAVNAMLLEAFHAETIGKKKYAEQCVHQGLMIQYCEKLGRDGIGMFFNKRVLFYRPVTLSQLILT
jgi:cell division cycle protein 37